MKITALLIHVCCCLLLLGACHLNVTFSEFVLYFRAEKGSTVYKLYRLESDHISDL